MNLDLAIVGAGAAGLTAGIFAAARLPSGQVAVLDGSKTPGTKILIAGGGRCNVTNRVVTPADFNGGNRHAIRNVLAAFNVERTVAWFADMGVSLHEEENGKLFPDSNQAATVLDALLSCLARNGAKLLREHRVTRIEPICGIGVSPVSSPTSEPMSMSAHASTLARRQCHSESGFVLTTSNGPILARRIILATGGKSVPTTGSDGSGYGLAQQLGHSLVPTTPALVPLVLDGNFHTDLSGISQEVELTLHSGAAKNANIRPAVFDPEAQTRRGSRSHTVRVTGSLLWTHFGISGPAVLDLSRHWLRARLEKRSTAVTANMLPGDDLNSAERTWLGLAATGPRTILRNALGSRLPTRVTDAILSSLMIDGRIPLAHLSKDIRRRLLTALLAWPLPIRDSRGYNHAEVTAGGVPLDEINPANMESRRCPGLHLVGEILDVDGRIGGFNFQWAWASGYVAGHAIARIH